MKKLFTFIMLLVLLPNITLAERQKATVFNPETNDRKEVFIGDPHAFDDGYILEVSNGYIESEDLLGASVVSDYYKYLSQTISATVTTLPVTSMTTTDGHTLTMEDFGSKVFLTIEPQNLNKKEIVMCTGISSLSFTGCTRGLAFYGTSTASVVDNRKTHQSGVAVTISNVHYVYEDLLDKDTNQVMTGDLTLNSNLTVTGTIDFSDATSVSVPEPTSNSHASTKFYSDNLAFAGFGTSTPDTAGGGYLTRREDIASSSYDSDAPRLLYSGVATTTRDVATTSIVATDPNGYIKQELIDLSEDWSFTGSTTLASTTFTQIPTIPTDTPTNNTDVISLSFLNSVIGNTYTAGMNIDEGSAIVMYSDGYIYESDSAISSMSGFIGFAQENISQNENGLVFFTGKDCNQSGLTIGSNYYLDDGLEVIDQTNDTADGGVGISTSEDRWQSFTTSESANNIYRVVFDLKNPSADTLILRIREGEGLGGALLYTSQATASSDATSFQITPPVSVSTSSIYSITLQSSGTSEILYTNTGVYTDGRNDFSSDNDYSFDTYYNSTSGDIVTSSGTNNVRVGVADSETSLIIVNDTN